MWLLNFIPDAWLHLFVHGIVTLGILLSIVGAIAKNIPFVKSYGMLIKLLGVLLFIVGVFFEGGYGVEMMWRNKAEQMQAKIDAAEKQSKEVNKKLDNALKEKTIIIIINISVPRKLTWIDLIYGLLIARDI